MASREYMFALWQGHYAVDHWPQAAEVLLKRKGDEAMLRRRYTGDVPATRYGQLIALLFIYVAEQVWYAERPADRRAALERRVRTIPLTPVESVRARRPRSRNQGASKLAVGASDGVASGAGF